MNAKEFRILNRRGASGEDEKIYVSRCFVAGCGRAAFVVGVAGTKQHKRDEME